MILIPRRLPVLLLGAVIAVSSTVSAAGAATKQDVVAAFYPVAYAVQRVGGARVDVTNLTPAGVEPHDLELTPKQVDEILDARLVFVMGRRFQPAVEQAASNRDGPTITLLDRLPIKAGKKTVDENDPTALDPHVWLDPVLMRAIVDEVRAALAKADPNGAATYERNAAAFDRELKRSTADIALASPIADAT